jgi:hypothetical protein
VISLQVVNVEARARLNEARQSSSGGVLESKAAFPS